MTVERQDAIRVIRVFLASPSDLGEERQAARAAVDEINKTVARPNGFHVDLIGWEDTLSIAGRPQATINEDLETCQMFIGMLWERWGMAPDTAGRFTSGFEEEFTLASERNARTGEPHMTLFFKDVEKSKLSDPGRELSKVIVFKQQVIDKREILFQQFSATADFQANVRLGIAAYIHRLDPTVGRHRPGVASSIGLEPSQAADDQPPGETWAGGGVEADFLGEAARTMASEPAGLSPVQIARLRLVAMAAGGDSNDEAVVGAHDANLLFGSAATLSLSPRETSALADAGTEASVDETKPLWTWLAESLRRFPPWLTYTTAIGPDRRRAGALRVLALLGGPLVLDHSFNAERVKEAWFGGEASSTVRNAALEYIAERGDHTLAALAEREFDRNDYATRKAALDAVITARGRESGRVAAQFAIGASFDAIGDAAMKVVLDGMAELESETLVTALDSRSGSIRTRAVVLLADRRAIDEPTLSRLFEDPSAEVRIAAIDAFERLVRSLHEKEAEKAFIRKQKEPSRGLLASFDATAEAAHRQWKRRRLSLLSFDDLHENGQHGLAVEDRVAARALGHRRLIADELRFDLDDRYQSHWARYLEIVRSKTGGGDSADNIVTMFDQHQEFRRKSLTRIAMDAIEKLADRKDLPRIRKAIDEEVCELTSADVDYLGRIGGWEDISRIGRITIGYGASALLTGARLNDEGKVAAILKLTGDRVPDLLVLDLPHDLLAGVISTIPNTRFRLLNVQVVESLLYHESAKVRKAAVLKSLSARTVREVRSQLDRYLTTNKKKYYNVIFWMDLARAQRRESYRPIVERELMRMRD